MHMGFWLAASGRALQTLGIAAQMNNRRDERRLGERKPQNEAIEGKELENGVVLTDATT